MDTLTKEQRECLSNLTDEEVRDLYYKIFQPGVSLKLKAFFMKYIQGPRLLRIAPHLYYGEDEEEV